MQNTKTVSGWLFTFMVLSVCAILLSPTLTYRMCVDQGVFAFMGSELLMGNWPYICTWESDFPGLMILQALEIFIFGKSVTMFRLFDLFFQLGNAYLIYLITYRVANRFGAYLAAAIFCLIYQGYGPWNTAQREGFGLFFILLGYWFYLTSERRNDILTALVIGLGFGYAVTIKPTLITMTIFYVPLLWSVNRKSFSSILASIVGFIAPTIVILSFYWSQGGLVHIYEACVGYQSIYTERLRGEGSQLQFWWSKLSKLGIQSVGISIIYGFFLLWGNARRERLMLYLGYLGSICAVFIQGTFAGYHYLPGLGVGSILIGTMFFHISSIFIKRYSVFQDWRVSAVTQLIIVQLIIFSALPLYLRMKPVYNLLTLHFLERPHPEEYRNGTVFDFAEDYDVAKYLEAHTLPHDPIQVWGYESLVYYLANRHAASRFQMTHPLVMRIPGQEISPMQQRWRQEFMNDVAKQRPKYIAVVQDDNWWWSPGMKTSEELLDDFPEWKEYIQNNYALEHKIGRFLIYRRV